MAVTDVAVTADETGMAVGDDVGIAAIAVGDAVGKATMGVTVGETARVADASAGDVSRTADVPVADEETRAGIGDVFKLAYWFVEYLVDAIPAAQALVAAVELSMG